MHRPKLIGDNPSKTSPKQQSCRTGLELSRFIRPLYSSRFIRPTKKPRILVIEDHAPTRLAMSELIRQAGGDVIGARDAEEGLKYLLSQRFDVLLTDLRMPVKDGFELLRYCEKLPPTHRPARVIAISSAYGPGGLHGQPLEFLPKPFSLATLLDMIGGKLN